MSGTPRGYAPNRCNIAPVRSTIKELIEEEELRPLDGSPSPSREGGATALGGLAPDQSQGPHIRVWGATATHGGTNES